MMIFIERAGDRGLEYLEAAETLFEKLREPAKPGTAIMLTRIEMEIMQEAYIVGLDKSQPMELIKVDPNISYLAICDSSVNLGRLADVAQHLKLMQKTTILIVPVDDEVTGNVYEKFIP